ncbi:Coiled-coil domain-containing protein [Intoshia linei]|uniref:Calcium uniporter protein n=1 Tax=Intoshia linei TaxID=1819745 RepID=A0A177AWQ2_9BILA|nr:Coiled-coil domain-containing protein [Intoshia linei]
MFLQRFMQLSKKFNLIKKNVSTLKPQSYKHYSSFFKYSQNIGNVNINYFRNLSNHNSIIPTFGANKIVIKIPLLTDKLPVELSNDTSDTLDNLQSDIRFEDSSVNKIEAHREDGTKISFRTKLSVLYREPFVLKLHDIDYKNSVSYNINAIEGINNSISVQNHNLTLKQEAIERIVLLEEEIEPYLKKQKEICQNSYKKTRIIAWSALAIQALQFGFLARLTWWEYSWDIMEPVTYFVTYATGMTMLAYYLSTKQEYLYPDAFNRQKDIISNKLSKKLQFDNESYNRLYNEIEKAKKLIEICEDACCNIGYCMYVLNGLVLIVMFGCSL